MKFWILLVIINVDHFTCENPKDEVELLPEAVHSERKKVKLFWSIMYEVCRTFCLWTRFCNKFCELFNPDDEPDFDMDFLRSTKHSRQTLWLYDTALKVCQDDLRCVENCLKMEFESDEETYTTSKEGSENVFKTLFEIVRQYFAKCAEMNSKPMENVDLVTVQDFCREITHGWSAYERTCVNSLT